MQIVIETHSYLSAAKDAGMSDAEQASVIDLIAGNPATGAPVPGTGGCRKVRVAKPGRGTSGGYRLITFYSGADIPCSSSPYSGRTRRLT